MHSGSGIGLVGYCCLMLGEIIPGSPCGNGCWISVWERPVVYVLVAVKEMWWYIVGSFGELGVSLISCRIVERAVLGWAS